MVALDMTPVEIICLKCQSPFVVFVSYDELQRWRFGNDPIHKAMPKTDENDRLILESGVCGNCWVIVRVVNPENN